MKQDAERDKRIQGAEPPVVIRKSIWDGEYLVIDRVSKRIRRTAWGDLAQAWADEANKQYR